MLHRDDTSNAWHKELACGYEIPSRSKATPAQRLICLLADWADKGEYRPCSQNAMQMYGYGYKVHIKFFGDEGHIVIAVRASTSDVIELRTLTAKPERRGHGTVALKHLCQLADALGVNIWLDACPYENGPHIRLEHLKEYYQRFGFCAVKRPQAAWLCGYHKWTGSRFTCLMYRVHVIGGSTDDLRKCRPSLMAQTHQQVEVAHTSSEVAE